MIDISPDAKIQQTGPNILAETAFLNFHDSSMVTMETNGLTNFLHRPSSCPPSLVPFCPFTAEKKAVKVMSYTLGYIELDILPGEFRCIQEIFEASWGPLVTVFQGGGIIAVFFFLSLAADTLSAPCT